MNNTPFFSVITASFNSERTIYKTIESLLNQTYTNYEYIIIDGNSKDTTLDIIKSFESKFKEKNIIYKFISEPDKGIYDAWNKGVKLANGEWISFIGSDDLYINDALLNYNEILQSSNNTNFICSKIEIVDENWNKLKTYGEPFSKEKLNRKMAFAQVGAFHKKDLFSLVGDFDVNYKIVGDFDFYLRAKEIISPQFTPWCSAKMMNTGISNQAYKALKEAYELKTKHKLNNKFINLFDFYFTLAKCKIKEVFK
jgi:glycosyltransferase involved in cell wall biosynthesis